MSFVYAFKHNDAVYMFGDTKVTINQNAIDNFQSENNLVKKIGILKTIILSPEIALGFVSDNLLVVENTLKAIQTGNFPKTIDDIIKILKDASLEKDNATDFVLIVKLDIYKISNGECEKTDICHIGSEKVFSFIQKEKGNRTITAGLINSLIKKAIEQNIDETVGEFCVQLNYNLNEQEFIYAEDFYSSINRDIFVGKNQKIPICGTIENGDFKYELYTIQNELDYKYLAIKFFDTIYSFMPLISKIDDEFKCEYKYLFLPINITEKCVD